MTQTQLDSTQYKPAGAATQVQFNGSGSMSGSANLTFDGTTLSVSQLKVTSIAAGFVPPVVTTAQKNAIVSPVTGSIVYDSDLGFLQEWNGSVWTNVAPSSSAGGSSGDLQYNNAGAFAGTANITTDGTNLTLSNAGSISLTTPISGGAINGGGISITTGINDGPSPTVGGGISITTGAVESGTQVNGNLTSGSINISTGLFVNGSGTPTVQGGGITLTTGQAQGSGGTTTVLGGGITLSTGPLLNSGTLTGGSITLSTGSYPNASGSNATTGGSITLTSGNSNGGTDKGGNITLTSSTAANGGSIVLTGTGANGTSIAPAHGNIYANYGNFNNLVLTNALPVISGGTGTSSPGLIAGANITSITGTWPNQTINAATQTISPAGSNTQIQFNNAGAFGASANLEWNGTALLVSTIKSLATAQLQDTSGVASVGWTARRLYDSGGNIALDWSNNSGPINIYNNVVLQGVSLSTSSSILLTASGTGVTLAKGSIIAFQSNSSPSYSVNVAASASQTSAYSLSWPIAQGAANSIIQNDGTGVLSFTATPTLSSLSLTTPLPVASGGTGTASPSLVAGSNISSITGTWPNQTINAATQQATVAYVSGNDSQYNGSSGFTTISGANTAVSSSRGFLILGSATITIQTNGSGEANGTIRANCGVGTFYKGTYKGFQAWSTAAGNFVTFTVDFNTWIPLAGTVGVTLEYLVNAGTFNQINNYSLSLIAL